jgi:hypothetical protein
VLTCQGGFGIFLQNIFGRVVYWFELGSCSGQYHQGKTRGDCVGPAGGRGGLHWFAAFVIFGSFLFCTHKNTMPEKLTRAQIKAGLAQVPIESLLSSGEGKEPKITGKMKAFAHAVALGETKANAYRKAYKPDATKRTLASKPYELARDGRIQREIEAYKLAIEAEKHRTPGQLKALLVQQLVQHSLDEDFPPAQRMKALALIGQLFEVGAFLERKESVIIHKSSDIRTRLLERIGKATDVEAKASDGLELLEEIRGDGHAKPAQADPTAGVATPEGPLAAGAPSHTIPLIQSPTKFGGGTPSEITDVVTDFDKE